mmetsp:Transcript_15359/g.41232  ORF Transcript_15359/g.41232 Transcript_15359/m.41232 type:complete len:230 (-) Transcript_15359:478-1167(-)
MLVFGGICVAQRGFDRNMLTVHTFASMRRDVRNLRHHFEPNSAYFCDGATGGDMAVLDDAGKLLCLAHDCIISRTVVARAAFRKPAFTPRQLPLLFLRHERLTQLAALTLREAVGHCVLSDLRNFFWMSLVLEQHSSKLQHGNNRSTGIIIPSALVINLFRKAFVSAACEQCCSPVSSEDSKIKIKYGGAVNFLRAPDARLLAKLRVVHRLRAALAAVITHDPNHPLRV